ncbi:unnamed protein product [Durusdinium trenchii]|uniref:Uncharacterized protein n=1 Tax=Durusdinium trenchii TaxID=1381693 RepID=A0ABP0IDQ9_9DINO
MVASSFANATNLDVLESKTSADVNREEEVYAVKESPPGQASYSLQSYEDLFPGFPLPADQPGQPGFAEDAPPELIRAMKTNDGETSVLCGASLGDNRISCGVHLFDDPKSGAPYVVPLQDTGRALKAVIPQEVGGAEDMAEDTGESITSLQSSGAFSLFVPGGPQGKETTSESGQKMVEGSWTGGTFERLSSFFKGEFVRDCQQKAFC